MKVLSTGVCSPLGMNTQEHINKLFEGVSSVESSNAFDFLIDPSIPISAIPTLDRVLTGEEMVLGAASRLAIAAVDQAMCDQKFSKLGIYIGTAHSESDVIPYLLSEDCMDGKSLWRGIVFDPVEHAIASHLKHRGRTVSAYSACTSSMHALAMASMDLEDGVIDYALVVGVDAISQPGLAGFKRIGASTTSMCKPFSTTRDGTLIGEGAVAMILTQASGRSSADILGIGMSCDAGHPTRPDPHGEGMERAIASAIRKAKISEKDIKAIVCHGSGTVVNDEIEASVIERIFGGQVPITSVKSKFGHTMGAAGLFNVLTAFEMCRRKMIPPTLQDLDEPIGGVNVVVAEQTPIQDGPVLVNCAAFGGNNVCAVMH